MTTLNAIRYLADNDVDDVMDAKLRTLLSSCFDDPQFKTQRFYIEMPQHRFLIDQGEHLAAHVAIHEKEFKVSEKQENFLGIAEVCVLPAYRGRGLVKAMLKEVEQHFSDIVYAILLGDPEVYSSSGYKKVNNIYFTSEPNTANPDTMVKTLTDKAWYTDKVMIEAPYF